MKHIATLSERDFGCTFQIGKMVLIVLLLVAGVSFVVRLFATPPEPAEVECENGIATVTVPVNPTCPDSKGKSKATVYDRTTKPPEGEKPVTSHRIKSISPCGCKTDMPVSSCIPNGVYEGYCENYISIYKIPCNCKH